MDKFIGKEIKNEDQLAMPDSINIKLDKVYEEYKTR